MNLTERGKNAHAATTRTWFAGIVAHAAYLMLIVNHETVTRFTNIRPSTSVEEKNTMILICVVAAVLGALCLRRTLRNLRPAHLSRKPDPISSAALYTLDALNLSCLLGIPGLALSLTQDSQEIAVILGLAALAAYLIQKPKQRTFETFSSGPPPAGSRA